MWHSSFLIACEKNQNSNASTASMWKVVSKVWIIHWMPLDTGVVAIRIEPVGCTDLEFSTFLLIFLSTDDINRSNSGCGHTILSHEFVDISFPVWNYVWCMRNCVNSSNVHGKSKCVTEICICLCVFESKIHGKYESTVDDRHEVVARHLLIYEKWRK